LVITALVQPTDQVPQAGQGLSDADQSSKP